MPQHSVNAGGAAGQRRSLPLSAVSGPARLTEGPLTPFVKDLARDLADGSALAPET